MSKEKKIRVNLDIQAVEVRLIDVQGQQLGIVPINTALKMSQEAGLDLVEVSAEETLPVCRIMDYGKYRFKLKKKRTDARKKQKQTKVKEIKIRPGTEEADYQVKLRSAIKFLLQGNKVKVTLRFRGREMAHPDLGRELLNRLKVDLEQYSMVEIEPLPQLEGRYITLVLVPKKR